MHFGKWLREHRKQVGMSQTECAARMGIKPQTLYKMEKYTESPNVETIPKVATAFDLTPEQVMAQVGFMPDKTTRVNNLAAFVEIQAQKVADAEREKFYAAAMGSISGIASAMSHA